MEMVAQPGLEAYTSYFLGFSLRYFLIAGAVVWVFHVLLRQRLLPYRVQQAFPPAEDVRHEIKWSLANAAATGLSAMLTYWLVHHGHTRMYFTIADQGWGWFAASALLVIVGHDTWIYWQHRMLHTDFFFEHVHSVHHKVLNPTAFATFAHHPIETLMGNTYFILFVVFVPIHPFALAAAGLYMYGHGFMGHFGYEFYPTGWTRHPLFGWFNTGTHHNMHHQYMVCNYGNWFNYWDTLMGTNHPAYHDTFDGIKARVRAAASAARLEPAPSYAREGQS
jgi:sterol desaturase/sphingolipid hydroxylase (fatty acid hydroxylase superfamily)